MVKQKKDKYFKSKKKMGKIPQSGRKRSCMFQMS